MNSEYAIHGRYGKLAIVDNLTAGHEVRQSNGSPLSIPIFRLSIPVSKKELVVPAQPVLGMNSGMEKPIAHSSYSATQSMLHVQYLYSEDSNK